MPRATVSSGSSGSMGKPITASWDDVIAQDKLSGGFSKVVDAFPKDGMTVAQYAVKADVSEQIARYTLYHRYKQGQYTRERMMLRGCQWWVWVYFIKPVNQGARLT